MECAWCVPQRCYIHWCGCGWYSTIHRQPSSKTHIYTKNTCGILFYSVWKWECKIDAHVGPRQEKMQSQLQLQFTNKLNCVSTLAMT